MTGIVFIIIGISLAFTAKGIADKLAHHWGRSIFRKMNPEGFWGPPSRTSKRKYDKTGILGWFERNLFVMFQDGWHLSNSVRRVGWFMTVIAALSMYPTWGGTVFIALVMVLVSMFGFHVIYHWTLDTEKNKALRGLWTAILIGAITLGTLFLNNNVNPKKIVRPLTPVEVKKAELQAEINLLSKQQVEVDSTIAKLKKVIISDSLILEETKRDSARVSLIEFRDFDVEAFLKANL